MHFSLLGSSDLSVSKISFGCMSLPENHPDNVKLLHRAIDLGINFFDTADLYQKGLNEETVGKALKGKRKKVLIATKVGNQMRADGSGWDWNPKKAYLKRAIHKSLKRLQTDYIDLYQLHGGTIEDPIEETIEAFEELKQAGHIRHYGISSIRPNVIRTWVEKSNLVSVMMQYSLLDRRPEESCLDLLEQNNIGVIVRGAIAKGLLAGKASQDYLSFDKSQVQEIQNTLASFKKENQTLAQAALQFVLKHPAVTTIAAGIRTMKQLEENAEVFEVSQLNEKDIHFLKELVFAEAYEKHK